MHESAPWTVLGVDEGDPDAQDTLRHGPNMLD